MVLQKSAYGCMTIKKRLAEYLMFNNANRIIKLSAIQFGLTKKLNMHKVISDSV